MLINRRSFFACTACAATPLFGFAQLTGSVLTSRGCTLNASELKSLDVERNEFRAAHDSNVIDSSGDAEMDRSLGRALARMSSRYGFSPSFAFYRDDKPNARAHEGTQTSGTWGSILFGRNLFRTQLQRYNDKGSSVIAIIAHEFGHIAQYRARLMDELTAGESTVRRVELHADYLAGWYLGRRKLEDDSISLWSAGDTFNRIGDFEFTNPNHHGTPEQRVRAAEAGFVIGKRKTDLADAIAEGKIYLKNVIL